MLAFAHQQASRAADLNRASVVDRFLNEELFYRIGFWLIPRCGAAQTSFLQTEHSRLYRATLEGRTTGIIDALVGRIRYSFVSYMEYITAADRLRPVYFELRKRHMQKASTRSVIYDYAHKKIVYSHATANAGNGQESESMENGTPYEDYLSFFYNFRHGVYGPMERGRTYHIPLHIQKGMHPLQLTVSSFNQTENQRQQEPDKTGKDFFLRCRVFREDVSSKSGEVEGWLSSGGLPMKGTIKNVIFFGDLWGELDYRIRNHQDRFVTLPETVRNLIPPESKDGGKQITIN